MNRPTLIAELGVNYYDTAAAEKISPLAAAFEYIDSAKAAGADAVKFQYYRADTLCSKCSPAYWDMDKEPSKTQYELFRRHESFGRAEFEMLSRRCREIGIDFLCTPFDYTAVDDLDDLTAAYKVSSSDLNNLPFLRYVARKGKPIYLSVGASYLSEVEEAVQVLQEENCPEICLLHCVLSYPCRREDANLDVIRTLRQVFPDLKIGYSDHTEPDETMTTLTAAYLLGAEVIEKHFTLDKTLPGNDHYHAGDPDDFRKAVRNFQLVQTVLGSGEKTVLPCELIPRREARRSLVLLRDVKEGEPLKPDDLMAKRPGTGIPPRYLEFVVGRSVRRDLPADTVLTWDMV